jgi:GcrA cell cycle regulator
MQTFWTDPQTDALKRLHATGMSYTNIAAQINAEFKTSFSRNAAIGRAMRVGLSDVKWTRPKRELATKRERKPRVRIIQANGNSNRQRVIETIESEPIKLRCAEVIPLNISIDELESGVCHYPYGDTPPYAYCGHATLGAGPYCDLHHELCHTPTNGMRWRERPDAASILRHSLLPAVFALATFGDLEAT